MLIKALLCAIIFIVPNLAFAGELMYPEGIRYYNLAVQAQKDGQYAEALSDYQNALLLGPQSDEFKKAVYNNSGVMAVREGDFDEAIRLFQDALSLDPKYKKAVYNLGMLYIKQGDAAKAMKIWEKLFDFPADFEIEDRKDTGTELIS